ncbi:MAG: 50S ribosomal protein L11 methyltransferase [Parvibaculum sp.]
MTTTWKVSFAAPFGKAEDFAAALAFATWPETHAVATSEVVENVTWRIDAYYETAPEEADIKSLLRDQEARSGYSVTDILIEPLPDINWVAKSLEGLAPIETERFFLHGAHDADKCPRGRIPLLVDAGEAFGTGHHGTTLGCLKMIEKVTKIRTPENALDLGCGTGVLAIALAKLTKRTVTASDIDPIATRVTRENARRNQVHPLIKAFAATGFDHPHLTGAAPYDLIIANILAKPLVKLAPTIEKNLVSGGTLVLSGILHDQEKMIISAYTTLGLKFVERLRINEWVTLRFQG